MRDKMETLQSIRSTIARALMLENAYDNEVLASQFKGYD
jgi:hypothetical protein